MTDRETLRLLYIEHRSQVRVAHALGWSHAQMKREFAAHEMNNWRDEFTDDEIRAAWLRAGRSVRSMARALRISDRTARQLLARVGIEPPGRGEWTRRERVQRGPGQKRLPVSLRTGAMARVLTWPSVWRWRMISEVYYSLPVGRCG